MLTRHYVSVDALEVLHTLPPKQTNLPTMVENPFTKEEVASAFHSLLPHKSSRPKKMYTKILGALVGEVAQVSIGHSIASLERDKLLEE